MVDYLNAICFMLIICFSFAVIFTTEHIKVLGNELVEETQVLKWLATDEFTCNSLYTWVKYNFTDTDLPKGLESVEIKYNNPRSLTIKVKEKMLVGGMTIGDQHVYYDSEGVVLLITSELRNDIVVFDGFNIGGVELYEKLPVEDIEIFDKMLELSVLVESEGLVADEIKHESGNVIAHINGVEILFGSENYELKVQQVSPILDELEGKQGVLNLENYESSDDMITFK